MSLQWTAANWAKREARSHQRHCRLWSSRLQVTGVRQLPKRRRCGIYARNLWRHFYVRNVLDLSSRMLHLRRLTRWHLPEALATPCRLLAVLAVLELRAVFRQYCPHHRKLLLSHRVCLPENSVLQLYQKFNGRRTQFFN